MDYIDIDKILDDFEREEGDVRTAAASSVRAASPELPPPDPSGSQTSPSPDDPTPESKQQIQDVQEIIPVEENSTSNQEDTKSLDNNDNVKEDIQRAISVEEPNNVVGFNMDVHVDDDDMVNYLMKDTQIKTEECLNTPDLIVGQEDFDSLVVGTAEEPHISNLHQFDELKLDELKLDFKETQIEDSYVTDDKFSPTIDISAEMDSYSSVQAEDINYSQEEDVCVGAEEAIASINLEQGTVEANEDLSAEATPSLVKHEENVLVEVEVPASIDSEAIESAVEASPPPVRSVIASEHDLNQPSVHLLTESEKLLGTVNLYETQLDSRPRQPTMYAMRNQIFHAEKKMFIARHHCRACGRVLCSECCKDKASLQFLGGKEARVCQPCASTLARVNDIQAATDTSNGEPGEGTEDLTGDGASIRQSVLKKRKEETTDSHQLVKQVSFSDGVRPGNGLDEAGPSGARQKASGRSGRKSKAAVCKILETESFLPEEEGSFPLIVVDGVRHGLDSIETVLQQLTDLETAPVQFAIKRNLSVFVKVITYNGMCVWNIYTVGMRCVGQDDFLFLIEKIENEVVPPLLVLKLLDALYMNAYSGSRVNDMNFLSFSQSLPNSKLLLFGDPNTIGFLFFRITVQETTGVFLPDPPFLVCLSVLRLESVWAQLLPSRLLYRLGFEEGVYPIPLVIRKGRQSVFTDVGHTVMNLLCDLHHFTYSLSLVRGATVHVQNKTTCVNIPKTQHAHIIRVLEGSSRPQHLLAWATDFNTKALSYLVCYQDLHATNYTTKLLNVKGKHPKITAASFILFNGSLKGVTDMKAHSCICEDGIRVDMKEETFQSLVEKLRKMEDMVVCAEDGDAAQQGGSGERIEIHWTDANGTKLNPGYLSPVDGTLLEELPCFKPTGSAITDQSCDGRVVRMTEIFVLTPPSGIPQQSINKIDLAADLLPLSRNVIQAVSQALLPFTSDLLQIGLCSLGVRITLGPHFVEFKCGAGGEQLTGELTTALDGQLVQLLYAHADSQAYSITVEMILRILNLR